MFDNGQGRSSTLLILCLAIWLENARSISIRNGPSELYGRNIEDHIMRLIGSFVSPYVRRVAVSLNALGIPFKSETPSVFRDPEVVRRYNPLVRIPALILDDGEELVDSYAILDAIDETIDPDRRLTPASGGDRRHVMKITAIAVGSMDKAVSAYYEGVHHPKEKIHQPWIDRNEMQLLGGLDYLNNFAEAAGDTGWLAGSLNFSQADISSAVVYSFAKLVRPKLGIEQKVPYLARFAGRCEAMDIFTAAPIPEYKVNS